jgi:hypothetical protein
MGHSVKLKYVHSSDPSMRILASTSVPFIPTTVQMPNLLLIERRRITVYVSTVEES